MSIRFQCPGCQETIEAPDKRAGAKGKCPHCQHEISVPATSETTTQSQPLPEIRSGKKSSVKGVAERDSKNITCELCGVKNVRPVTRCSACGEPIVTKEKKPNKNTVKIGDVLSETREIFQQQMGMTIGAVIIPGFIYIVSFFVSIFIFGIALFTFFAMINTLNVFLIAGAYFIFSGIAGLILAYLAAGSFLILLKISRGKRTNIGHLLSGSPYAFRLFGNGFLIWIVNLLVAVVCLLIGGFIDEMLGLNLQNEAIGIIFYSINIPFQLLMVLIFWPLPYFIIDRDQRGIQPIISCFSYLKYHWIASLFAVLIFVISTILGTLLFGLGLILTLPFCALMFAIMYCHLTGRRTAA